MVETATTFALSSGANDLILGLVAGVLVVFALVVSLVLPRRNSSFPGRRTGLFFTVAVLLVAGMLVAVEALGESHDFGAGHEAGGTEQTTPGDTQPSETGETGTGGTGVTGGGETGETGGEPAGDPAAGQEVFAGTGCGSCHALAEANATGTIGPNLDEALGNLSPEETRTQIVDPNSEIAAGFGPGIMPQDYGEQLTDEQLADLVAFLAQATSG